MLNVEYNVRKGEETDVSRYDKGCFLLVKARNTTGNENIVSENKESRYSLH